MDDLALGVLRSLPGSSHLDKEISGIFDKNYTDKSIIVMNSTGRNDAGLMPASLRFIFQHPEKDAATLYTENLDWVFADTKGIEIKTPPRLSLK